MTFGQSLYSEVLIPHHQFQDKQHLFSLFLCWPYSFLRAIAMGLPSLLPFFFSLFFLGSVVKNLDMSANMGQSTLRTWTLTKSLRVGQSTLKLRRAHSDCRAGLLSESLAPHLRGSTRPLAVSGSPVWLWPLASLFSRGQL